MKTAFAPLSLKWRLAPGAKLPGLRSSGEYTDGGWPVADAMLDAVKADHLLQALAVGASEDELVAAAPGALPAIYHLLAQLSARRLLEIVVDVDGEVLCLLLPRRRDFHQPLETELPKRVALDRFAYLRAGRRGAVLELPDARCDIVAESSVVRALIGQLASAPMVLEQLDPREERPLVALLVALGFAGDADAPDTPSRRTWEFHDRLFHAWSQLFDDGVARGATYRFQDRMAAPPAVRPRHQGTEITLPDPQAYGPKGGRTLSDVMSARKSGRDLDGADLSIAELSEVLHRVGRMAIRRHGNDGKEWLARPLPSAGGLQALEFYIATYGCIGLSAGFFHYRSDIHALTRFPDGDAAADEMLRQCARAWDEPDRIPPVLVVLAARLPRIAWKYEGVAYRLALLDAGVALQSLYLVTTDLGLAGAAVGASDPDLFAQASGVESWEETCVAAFGFGRPRASVAVPAS